MDVKDKKIGFVLTGSFCTFSKTIPKMKELKKAGADIIPVDIGVKSPLDIKGIIQRKIKLGTDNMVKGPAMSREEAIEAILTGVEVVRLLKNKGYIESTEDRFMIVAKKK